MIDLTGQNKIITNWSYDEELDVMTLEFRDVNDAISLGELKIEGKRFRSLTDALEQTGRVFFPPTLDLTTRENHITIYDGSTGKSTTEFT